jgi:hypothetical protein
MRQLVRLQWARESPFQLLQSVSSFFSLSNSLGNLLFARQSTQVASVNWVLAQFWLSGRAGASAMRRTRASVNSKVFRSMPHPVQQK